MKRAKKMRPVIVRNYLTGYNVIVWYRKKQLG